MSELPPIPGPEGLPPKDIPVENPVLPGFEAADQQPEEHQPEEQGTDILGFPTIDPEQKRPNRKKRILVVGAASTVVAAALGGSLAVAKNLFPSYGERPKAVPTVTVASNYTETHTVTPSPTSETPTTNTTSSTTTEVPSTTTTTASPTTKETPSATTTTATKSKEPTTPSATRSKEPKKNKPEASHTPTPKKEKVKPISAEANFKKLDSSLNNVYRILHGVENEDLIDTKDGTEFDSEHNLVRFKTEEIVAKDQKDRDILHRLTVKSTSNAIDFSSEKLDPSSFTIAVEEQAETGWAGDGFNSENARTIYTIKFEESGTVFSVTKTEGEKVVFDGTNKSMSAKEVKSIINTSEAMARQIADSAIQSEGRSHR